MVSFVRNRMVFTGIVHWNIYSQLPLLQKPGKKLGKCVFAEFIDLKRHMTALFIISSGRNYSQLQ